MDKKTSPNHFSRPIARRLVQLYAALLYNAHLRGFINGKLYTGSSKAICVPGLNCYSCPGAVGACPLGSLQNALSASGHTVGWYVFGILLLFGILLGRTVCGWLCPAGLIQELLHRIPTPKLRKSRFTRALTWVKYAVLAVFVIVVPIYYGLFRHIPLPAFCKFICPAGTLEGAVSLLSNPTNSGLMAQLGALFTNKFIIMVAVGLACIFCYRAFCRFLCPLGAIYSLFNRYALTGVKVDLSSCTRCGACVRVCEMDVRFAGDRECISCGKCVASCGQKAISVACGKIVLHGPNAEYTGNIRKQPRRLFQAGMLLLLCAVLVLFNLPDGSGSTPTGSFSPSDQDYISNAPVGWQTGQQLEDFSCTLCDGTEFRLSDCRGKVVLINQWATYCTPCVEELPYFERLQEEHPEIVVLAVHHWLEASPKANDYIEQMGWHDWQLRFTVDTADMNILSRIHGDGTMPRTVVLNRRGEVVFNEQRSMTYEMLNAVLDLAEQ